MLTISKKDIQEMKAHALQENPNECCGILIGVGEEAKKLHRVVNVEESPYRYRMDPLGQLEADKDADKNGWEFVAFYHSHTHSPAYPSSTDVRVAVDNGWLNVKYVLVSLMDKANPAVRVFSITSEATVIEEELKVKGE